MTTTNQFDRFSDFIHAVKKASDSGGKDVDERLKIRSPFIENPETTCRLGQGNECCAFLVLGPSGFECAKNTGLAMIIEERLEKGITNAKGIGGWSGCPLEKK